ncbi:hypothetical protein Leryth_007293 [Lithospermum erythrorhizon]|nr:hypothetical protein Leryth_007293 [Lithospermum erythrorhizon]
MSTFIQGMAQGCILSMASLANIVSPLIYSPLTALFLSDGAPFSYPGFSILCIGLAWLIAFITSTMIPSVTSDEITTTDNLEA